MSEIGNSPTGSQPESGEREAKRDRSTLTKVLPTDRIGFEKQVSLLRASAAIYESNGGQPVTNEQIGEVTNFSGSTVSQTNGFFCDVGLWERSDKGGFIPSAETIAYNKTCQWDEAEARLHLRPVFERTWFYRLLVPRLQLAPQAQGVCLALLGTEAKASKEHNERLQNLLAFLDLARIVTIVGGTVSLAQIKPAHQPQDDSKTKITIPQSGGQADPKGMHTYVLPLDKENKRNITVIAPLDITQKEVARISKWLEVSLLIDSET